MEYEIDNYNGKIIKVGNSLAVLIPSNIIKFGGYKKRDTIRVYIKKVGGINEKRGNKKE
jgi:antitoxin component of MazEF toxin-antitoxin module